MITHRPGVLPHRMNARLEERAAIVVPSWNARPFLERALSSLERTTGVAHEVVVVDNGSTDGALDVARAWVARASAEGRAARLLENGENRYFSTACNQGFAAASLSCKYLVLFCNDVEVKEPGWLEALVAAAKGAGVGAVGHAAERPVEDLHRALFRSHQPVYERGAVARGMERLLAAPGARYLHVFGFCFLVRREAAEDVGLYLSTGEFRQYHSDWEWVMRIQTAGYRVVPRLPAVHHWHSVSELLAFHPARYAELVRALEDPETVARYLRTGRPLFEEESGYRALAEERARDGDASKAALGDGPRGGGQG